MFVSPNLLAWHCFHAGFTLPDPAVNRTIQACGETYNINVFDTSAELLEVTLRDIMERVNAGRINGDFALNISRGVAVMTKQILSFMKGNVVLMGERLSDSRLLTEIDLGQTNIWLSPEVRVKLCVQDVRFVNGKVAFISHLLPSTFHMQLASTPSPPSTFCAYMN